MDPEAKSTAGLDRVVDQSPRYISGGTVVGTRVAWLNFPLQVGVQGTPPRNLPKKRMQIVHSETILADGVPFFSLEFYLGISKFDHKATWEHGQMNRHMNRKFSLHRCWGCSETVFTSLLEEGSRELPWNILRKRIQTMLFGTIVSRFRVSFFSFQCFVIIQVPIWRDSGGFFSL